MNEVAIKSLAPGDQFRFSREVTVWTVVRKHSEAGLTSLEIFPTGEDSPTTRCRFSRPSLTYVTKVG